MKKFHWWLVANFHQLTKFTSRTFAETVASLFCRNFKTICRVTNHIYNWNELHLGQINLIINTCFPGKSKIGTGPMWNGINGASCINNVICSDTSRRYLSQFPQGLSHLLQRELKKNHEISQRISSLIRDSFNRILY